MDFLQNIRAYLDPALILQENLNWGIYLAMLGLIMGIVTAFILWYRSARLISILEGEQADLRRGDILGGDTASLKGMKTRRDVTKDTAPTPTLTVPASTEAEVAVTTEGKDDEFRLPTVFSEEPADADDLTLLEGIDDDKAAEMRKAGIYKFSQLEGLDEEERRKFGFRFGWPDINWGSWAATAASAGAIGAFAAKKDDMEEIETTTPVVEEIAAVEEDSDADDDVSFGFDTATAKNDEEEFQLKTTYAVPPVDADDLTRLEGVDAAKAEELNRAGIYKFSQLEELDEEERAKFGRKFQFPDIDWGKWGTIGALGAGAAAVVKSVSDDEEEESETVTIDADSEEEEEIVLKTTFDEEPEDADDLTLLEGIDAEKAQQLRSAGIYKFSQLEELDEEERAKFGRKFQFPDIDWGKWTTVGALGAGAAAVAATVGDDDDEEEEEIVLKTTFDEEPEDADDLTQLEGIDAEKAEQLRSAGIYKFSQLEELDEEERAKFGRKFQFPDIDWGKWTTVGALGAGAAVVAKSVSDDDEDQSADEEVETVTFAADSETSEDDTIELKTVYSEPPADADDLTLLEGIDSEKAAALNEAGIYKFSQLEELDEEQRESFGKKFKWPDLDWGKWAALGAAGTAAATLLKGDDDEAETSPAAISTDTEKIQLSAVSGEAKPDWTWGYTFKENTAEGDDLTSLEGISEEDAARLNAEGIYSAKQLEELPEEKREEVKSRFGWDDIDWGKWTAAGAVAATGAAIVSGSNDERNEESDTQSISPTGEAAETDWKWGYTFDEKPDEADDLTLMEGVSAEDAEELNRQGVYTFKQLENLPEDQQTELKKKFGWDSIDWGKWGTLSTAGVAATAVATVAKSDDEEDSTIEVKAPEPIKAEPAELPDPEEIWETESSKLSSKDLDTSGKYGELSLTTEDFSGQLEESFSGETVEVHPRYGIIYPSAPDSIDDLTKIRGIGLATEKQLNANGIYKFKQIANWNAGSIEGISTDLDLGTRVRDDDWVYQAQSFATGEPEAVEEEDTDSTDYTALINSKYSGQNVDYKKGLGILYKEAPENPDDLSEIKGIGSTIEEKLNEYGVYKFSQLADWNESNISAFNDRLSFKGRIEREDWVGQATKLAKRVEEEADYVPETSDIPLPDASSYDDLVSRFAGESVDVDPALGLIYRERPDNTDDLKQIWGIGSRIEGELNKNGIYRFAQIAGWNDYNIRQFDERLDLKGRIQRDHWISQSESLAKESGELQSRYGSIISDRFSGEAVTVKPRYGVVYTQPPADEDDLTEINGIGPVTDKQLIDVGIYKFKQIANWDDEAIAVIEEDIDGPGRVSRDKWVEQARDFDAHGKTVVEEAEPDRPDNMSYLDTLAIFDGENVDIDEKFGIIYTGRPTHQDDLKRIRGVGKFLERELNDRGVYCFKQVANWNDYNIWAFGKDLSFPGRITREGWVDQAKELAELEEYRAQAEETAKTDYADKAVRIDPELGVVYQRKPDSYDDLTQLDGIDKEVEGRLNSDGIYTFDQIKSLQGPQRKVFQNRFGFGDIDWSKWTGLSALGGIGAAGAAALGSVKDEVVDFVEDKVEDVKEVVAPVETSPVETTDDEGHGEEPKGIFGTGDDEDSGSDRRVAFIMDVSRSLTPAQLRLSKMELSAAVSALPEGALYQVIFFSGPTWFAHQRMVEGGARGEDVVIEDGDEKLNWRSGFGGFEYEGGNENLPGSEWREVTPENIAATLEDIEAVGKSYGTTWHLPLTMAMNLEPAPKNVYFLTDGETARQDQVAEEMVEMAKARGNTKLNTIALMVPGASVPLHRMADGTGGEYSLVIAGGKVLKDDELREYLAEKDIALND